MLLGIQNNLHPLTILSNEQVEEIHQATLNVLENTSVRVLSQQALNILKEAHCTIDNNKVYMTSELIEDTLRRCPSSFTWHNVHPNSDKYIKLEPGRVNYTISHSPTHVIDFS